MTRAERIHSIFPKITAISPTYPDYVAIADGRIYSTITRKFLRPLRAGKGYRSVWIGTRSRGARRRYVHRLMLEFFRGPAPAGMEACHANGDRSDNRIDNLRWDTRRNNHADKRSHGTSTVGERHPQARLTETAVRQIRARVAAGASQRSLCAEYGVTPNTISRAVRGVSWSHV